MVSTKMNEYEPLAQYDFLFKVKEKEISATIFDLGTKYDRISESILSAKLVSDDSRSEEKLINMEILEFLISVDFIDKTDHYFTEYGRKYFEGKYILGENDAAEELIKTQIIHLPVVNLMGQVFYGRGKVNIGQLQSLLNYHKVANWELAYSDITTLLTLLNKYGILIYDKKNKMFYLDESLPVENALEHHYVTPQTPFSNLLNLRKVLRGCKGDIYWVDKHFRKEGLEIIPDGIVHKGLSSITIISGKDNFTQSAYNDYRLLHTELAERNIALSWRIIDSRDFKWHDRWIVADNCCYNIPPVLAIIRGQRSDIVKMEQNLEIKPFLENSVVADSLRE